MGKKVELSVLELAIVREGENHRHAIGNTVEIAQHLERIGYKRIWLAEHHNMPHIASSAPTILIGHIAENTQKIRVGSGGIMLPNHSPLVVAEQFGTLASIYNGRIDLGLGRAPGSDQDTARAIRKNNMDAAYVFPSEIRQLQRYLSTENATAKVRAFPGEGLDIPLYLLGSSTDSAYLAAELGLPYAFAAHFAPAALYQAIHLYKSNFKPSTSLKQPYMIACVNVIGADTVSAAEHLQLSLLELIIGILTNSRAPMKAPTNMPALMKNPEVKHAVDAMLACTFVGDKASLSKSLRQFIADAGIDELMVASHIYDLDAKKRSFEILREALA